MRLKVRQEPAPDSGTLLVQALAGGVCGTDRESIAGACGWAPSGGERLALGHESLGRVLEAPPGCPISVKMFRRRVPLARWHEAFDNRPDDIKVILQFSKEAT